MPTQTGRMCRFLVIFGEFVISQWVDVGIDPYRGNT